MSVLLCEEGRYQETPNKFDALRGEWFSRIFDSWPDGKEEPKIPFLKIALILLIYFGPIYLFSAIPSATFGDRLLGKGGLVVDIGTWSLIFYNSLALVLIAKTRRVLDGLPNELALRGIMEAGVYRFDPSSAPAGRFLRFLERISRVDGYRGLVWYFALFGWDTFCYYFLFLLAGKPTWHTSPAEQETFFYFLRAGNVQPNLAGIWNFMAFSPLGAYSVVLIARLFIVFACLCSDLAKRQKISIVPCHPDGVGGLRPVGQVALLYSVFTFIIGICVVAMITNELVVNVVFQPGRIYGSSNLWVLFGLCGFYLFMGTFLFFLPLVPLRSRMSEAKRTYLEQAARLQVAAERKHRLELEEGVFKPDSLQGLAALGDLIRIASEMAVWPFDRKTFLRYAGLLVAPLSPFLADLLPRIIGWLRAYLGL